jgi:preprotein translocase subunit SecD
MILYYRRSGFVAVGCVVLNCVYLLAVLALFGATLTLPGIAGLALTVGMAVDANVLIFERIREELAGASSMRSAIEAGFDRAHRTIIDANLTHLLAGIILYIFGTGPVKGFAVTLSIGIATTLFCAIYISKLCFELLDLRNAKGQLSI